MEELARAAGSSAGSAANLFMLVLSVCHTVVLETLPSGKTAYQAERSVVLFVCMRLCSCVGMVGIALPPPTVLRARDPQTKLKTALQTHLKNTAPTRRRWCRRPPRWATASRVRI